MITRIAMYIALGTLCSVLGFTITSTEFWCFLGLFWCADTLGRQAGFENGVVTGMDTYRRMSTEQRADIDRILQDEK